MSWPVRRGENHLLKASAISVFRTAFSLACRRGHAHCCATLLAFGIASAARASADGADQAQRMAADLVGRLTLEEKLPQLLNVATAIPRLSVPAYNWWTESLHGAIGTLPTTNFPEPIGLAATFDAPLVHSVASTISSEVRGLHTLARQTGKSGRIGTGLDTWSPNINIFRDPRWGRGQETYGEDPYLTARMAVAFVTGMQGPDPDRPEVIATPKHFAVHSGPESTRHNSNVYVSRHDLEDTFLPAFRAAIVEGKAGSIMCAYNRIDGQPACANDMLLRQHLRGAWGFTGYVVSDCDAVRDISETHHYAPDAATAVAAAMRAGVDNECNTATLNDIAGLPDKYRQAMERGLITVEDVDRALVRLFSARYRNGDLPGLPSAPAAVPIADVGRPSNGTLALRAAEESLVLLKNNGILPIREGLKLAVIGPLADATRVLRGNYSSALSGSPVSVVDGLRHAIPSAKITLVPFGESFTDGDRVPTSALRTPTGKPGLLARYYNPVETPPAFFAAATLKNELAAMTFAGAPVVTRVEPDVAFRSLDLRQVSDHHRAVWTGFLVPPESGEYRLGLSGDHGKLELDGKPFLDRSDAGYGTLPTLRTIRLKKARRYAIVVTAESHSQSSIDLLWKRVSLRPDEDMRRAARDADILVAVVGLTSDLEAEESRVNIPGFAGGDKTTLDLPKDQTALLESANRTGKPLIVIAMNGSPINLRWAKGHAAAIVEAWYPGQSGGLAIGHLLSGRLNPAGRLPLTFYESVDDLPPFDNYQMKDRTYRYFTGPSVYPFGFGLSYTQFTYAPLTLTAANGGAQFGLRVSTEILNSGTRPGAEVAQLYLNFPDVAGAPRVALRGFLRVSLNPGERRKVEFDLSSRDLSSVTEDGSREVIPGVYRVSVGAGQPMPDFAGSSAQFSAQGRVILPE
jgi:beta-glucosidase